MEKSYFFFELETYGRSVVFVKHAEAHVNRDTDTQTEHKNPQDPFIVITMIDVIV